MKQKKLLKHGKIGGIWFAKSNLGPHEIADLLMKLKLSRKKERKLYKSFELAAQTQGLAAIRKAATDYFNSVYARFIAAVEMNKKREVTEKQNLEECYEIALGLQVHKPITEKVRVFFKPKKSGGTRPISVFGPRHGTAQRLLKRLLLSFYSPKIWQYTSKGPKAAVKAAKKIPIAEGSVAVTLDIKNFYGSFIDEGVTKLLKFLPSDVVANVVLANDVTLSDMDWSPLCVTDLSIARSGVPQGSAVSPLVGELAISHLDVELPSGIWFANYADDFLVIAPTEDLAEIAKLALSAAVAALPSGHFILEERERAPIKSGVTFLGHSLLLEDGKLLAQPSSHANSKFADKLEELMHLAGKAKQNYTKSKSPEDRQHLVVAVAAIYWFGLNWRTAFSECENISVETLYQEVVFQVKKYLAGTDIKHDEFKAVKPEIEITFLYD
ncbi:MAG: hypothetical protein GC184_10655 [Rhizobiales bacterium]|nr:hypothetical protein [Hyphomicrobiales bacterium]